MSSEQPPKPHSPEDRFEIIDQALMLMVLHMLLWLKSQEQRGKRGLGVAILTFLLLSTTAMGIRALNTGDTPPYLAETSIPLSAINNADAWEEVLNDASFEQWVQLIPIIIESDEYLETFTQLIESGDLGSVTLQLEGEGPPTRIVLLGQNLLDNGTGLDIDGWGIRNISFTEVQGLVSDIPSYIIVPTLDIDQSRQSELVKYFNSITAKRATHIDRAILSLRENGQMHVVIGYTDEDGKSNAFVIAHDSQNANESQLLKVEDIGIIEEFFEN